MKTLSLKYQENLQIMTLDEAILDQKKHIGLIGHSFQKGKGKILNIKYIGIWSLGDDNWQVQAFYTLPDGVLERAINVNELRKYSKL